MEITANRMDRGFYKYQDEYEQKALQVLRSGYYILGPEVAGFEKEFAEYVGAKYCVGLASGLDALWLAVKILGIGAGDEVIVQGNTYIASVMGITINGATPVFVEPNDCFGLDADKIEEKITKKTKAIMVVHLYGMATEMDKILQLCKKYDLKLIEDCAQSHGAKYKGVMTGNFGDVGCFSFYPTKNLGAYGDGGAVVVNDKELDKQFRIYRNYGSEKRYYNQVVGTNSRLDELQAAMLRVKLSHLDELNAEKAEIAAMYLNNIKNHDIMLPTVVKNSEPVWHQFVIRCDRRDELKDYLQAKGIQTLIHYPIPPHLAQAYAYLNKKVGDYPITEKLANTVLSLPLYNGMTKEECAYVIDAINEFN